jgi:hypothetical protein
MLLPMFGKGSHNLMNPTSLKTPESVAYKCIRDGQMLARVEIISTFIIYNPSEKNLKMICPIGRPFCATDVLQDCSRISTTPIVLWSSWVVTKNISIRYKDKITFQQLSCLHESWRYARPFP